jgi:sec-independent protein translocase protein TatB
VFNFSGSEIVFLLLLALIILGPEKLPEAIRKFGSTYAEFKKVTTGFQTELKQALDEPVREMRETAEMLKQAATFDVVNPADEVKKAAIGAFPAGTPTAAPATPASATAGSAATDASGADVAPDTSDTSDSSDASDGSRSPAAGDDAPVSADPTDPSGAAPPRVSQIAQANASANQPFAREAAAAAAAAAAAEAATTDSAATAAQPAAVPSQYVQRMRTLDEVFGGTTSPATPAAGATDAPTGLADHDPPAADGADDGQRPA